MDTIEVKFSVQDWIWLCDFISATLNEVEKEGVEHNEYDVLRDIDRMKHILAMMV